MNKMTLIFITIWGLAFAYPSNAKSFSEPPMPKLNCNKMVSDFIKAIKEQDFESYCRLLGKESTEYRKSKFKREVDGLEGEGSLPYILDKLNLFPEIGELPEWTTVAIFEFDYLEGNKRNILKASFELKDNTWIIEQIRPNLGVFMPDELDEKKIKRMSGRLSPPPLEGEKTLDAGLTEIMKKFVSDFSEKNWDSIKNYTMYKYTNLMEALKKEGKEFGEVLSQFPSIGPIPAPAYGVEVLLKGKAESKEVKIDIRFKWEDNTLGIPYIKIKY